MTILAAVLSLFSMIGSYWTGKIIDQQKEQKLASIQKELNIVQPRHLSNNVRSKLTEKLLLIEGQAVVMVSKLLDGESFDYAKELENVFREANWQIGRANSTLLNNSQGLLTIGASDDNNPEERIVAVKNAFLYAGINYQPGDIKEASVSLQSQPNTIYIFIGRK